MKTISIDDDLYDFIAGNTKEIGEPASKILRRLLLDDKKVAFNEPLVKSDLVNTIESRNMKFMSAVDQMLTILGEAYKDKKDSFQQILSLQGRDRKYFAKSEEEIIKSGKTTQPKNIPNSPYWVMTNSSTTAKRKLCRQVLETLGYPSEIAQNISRKIT